MYTWNNQWIKPFESPWSIVNKFMLANEINGPIAASTLTTGKLQDIKINRMHNIKSGIVSNYKFNETFCCKENISLSEYGEETLKYYLTPLLSIKSRFNYSNDVCSVIFDKSFRYCPDCIVNGEHMIFHQFTFLDRCLIHDSKLTSKCPHCNNDLHYEIIFIKNLKAYQCKYCGKFLFKGNFSEIIEEWYKPSLYSKTKYFKNCKNKLILISNDFSKNLNDTKINLILQRLFLNKSVLLVPNYTIKKGSEWEKTEISKRITSRINEKSHIVEYAYAYSFQCLSRNLRKRLHVGKKISAITNYVSLCYQYKIVNENTLNNIISKYFDSEALSFFLWKRDLEYNNTYDQNQYSVNIPESFYYKFFPSEDIMNYLKNIKGILPVDLNDNIVFSVLVHISVTLMLEKYREWVQFITYHVTNYNKYELLNIIRNISFRNSNCNYNNLCKEFLLILNEKQEFQLYFNN